MVPIGSLSASIGDVLSFGKKALYRAIGTGKRVSMARKQQFSQEQVAALTAFAVCDQPAITSSRVEKLVTDLIGRVADKWTMLVLETLVAKGELRFTRLAEFIPGVSQKMLTQTLRAMERDGLLVRTVHPVIPPKVEYKLTELGLSLSAAFCGVWMWAEKHLEQVEAARAVFDGRG